MAEEWLPINGISANLIRQNRALFKLTMRQCEELMRAEALVYKLHNGKVLSL